MQNWVAFGICNERSLFRISWGPLKLCPSAIVGTRTSRQSFRLAAIRSVMLQLFLACWPCEVPFSCKIRSLLVPFQDIGCPLKLCPNALILETGTSRRSFKPAAARWCCSFSQPRCARLLTSQFCRHYPPTPPLPALVFQTRIRCFWRDPRLRGG